MSLPDNNNNNFENDLSTAKNTAQSGAHYGKKAVDSGIKAGKGAYNAGKFIKQNGGIKNAAKAAGKKAKQAAADAAKRLVYKIIGCCLAALIIIIIPVSVMYMIASIFFYEDGDAPSVFEAQKQGILSILTGQYTYSYEGQTETIQTTNFFEQAYNEATNKAQAYIDENYSDHDNSDITINVYPTSIDDISDLLIVEMTAVDTAIEHHLGVPGRNEDMTLEEQKEKEGYDYSSNHLAHISKSAFKDGFFTVGEPSASVTLVTVPVIKEEDEEEEGQTQTEATPAPTPKPKTRPGNTNGRPTINLIPSLVRTILKDNGEPNADGLPNSSSSDDSGEAINYTNATEHSEDYYDGTVSVKIDYNVDLYRTEDRQKAIEKIMEKDGISEEEATEEFENEISTIYDQTLQYLIDSGVQINMFDTGMISGDGVPDMLFNGETTILRRGSPESMAMWNSLAGDLASNGLYVLGGWCTDFVRWRMLKYYGRDVAAWEHGNGGQVAAETSQNSGGKFKHVVGDISQVRPGTIFSQRIGSDWGHVGFIEKIENGLIYISEGNVAHWGKADTNYMGIDFNHAYTISEFMARDGILEFAIPTDELLKDVGKKTTTAPDESGLPNQLKQVGSYLYYVSKSHGLPKNYEPSDLVNFKGSGKYLRRSVANALGKLIDGASKDGINLYLSSGYRSEQTQEGLFAKYYNQYGDVAYTISAKAGYSEHQTGLAADVMGQGLSMNESYGHSAEAHWIRDNAWKYGFILRYPEGKTDITGYAWEWWHIRYVGTGVARGIHNKGADYTYEEYFGLKEFYRKQTDPADGIRP